MNIDFLKGTGVALVTPFDDRDRIDYSAHQRIIDHVINHGVDFLVVNGTTGESAVLTSEEKQELMEKTVHAAAGRAPVVAGFGGNNTAAVTRDLAEFDLRGIDAVLSVSPSYNKPTQDGIYAHFRAVADATSLPVILYNVPSRTSSNISAETTLRLFHDTDNIKAIKEATYDLDQITHLAKYKPDGFVLLSGSDDLVFHQMALGFDGVVSVAANVIPARFTRMIELCRKDRFREAGKIHTDLYDFISMLFSQGNPSGAKAALHHLGLCDEHVRLPLVNIKPKLSSNIRSELKRITGLG